MTAKIIGATLMFLANTGLLPALTPVAQAAAYTVAAPQAVHDAKPAVQRHRGLVKPREGLNK